MPLHIIRNDITLMTVDAIVAPANRALRGSGGAYGAIHRAAGPRLQEACSALAPCKTGDVRITDGYGLPSRHVIHTVGPVWRGGFLGEKEKLASCYRRSLLIAAEHGLRSVAFPLISAGAHGYPHQKALKTAVDAISAFLWENDADLQVYLVLFDPSALAAGSKLFADVQQYIDDNYVQQHLDSARQSRAAQYESSTFFDYGDAQGDMCADNSMAMPFFGETISSAPRSLEEELDMLDETFSCMVLRKIAEKGMKNAECYKKANLDKKLFSKINTDPHYKPKKQTALALAIALELSMEETRELLMKAGLALSRSEKFDVIVEYFIKKGKYDLFEINEVLFYYDQPLLGCVSA